MINYFGLFLVGTSFVKAFYSFLFKIYRLFCTHILKFMNIIIYYEFDFLLKFFLNTLAKMKELIHNYYL